MKKSARPYITATIGGFAAGAATCANTGSFMATGLAAVFGAAVGYIVQPDVISPHEGANKNSVEGSFDNER